MSFSRFLVPLCASVAAAIIASACAFSGLDSAAGVTGGGDATSGGAGGNEDADASVTIGSDGDAGGDPYTRYADLCGEGCKPGGDPAECAPGGDPGMDGSADQVLFCQLVLDDGAAAPQCSAVGTYEAAGPCVSAADCAAGLGCAATDGMGGLCRQYCCGSVEDCAAGTYCAPQPMAEAVAAGETDVEIPVCIPASNCELLNDSPSNCPDGLTCTIVRADGTTSCVEPGLGRAHEACPCAPGFVCSMLTNECKKLCHVDEGAADCGIGAKCQGGSMGYPDGFGICVGGDS